MAELLVEVGVVLTAVAAAGALAARLGQSVIPAYILAGVLVGPNPPTGVLGVPLTLVEHREYVEVLAELGVVFLLFFLGLEFSLDRLIANRTRLASVGAIDFVVNFGAGVALGVAFGLPALVTLFLAGVVYISSSAVVTKSLVENGWVANPEAEPILGTLVVEDILIAVYLAVLSAVALGGQGVEAAAAAVARAFAFLAALTLVAHYGTAAVERLFAADADELFLLRVVGVTTLVAGGALVAGVSEAVAAFFVGTAFSTTGHVERIERVVAPARDVFAAVFFFSIGLTVDVTALPAVAGLLAVAVVVTTASKLASGTLSGRQYGLSGRRAARVGLGLVPRGEFSLVLAALAAGAGPAVSRVVPPFAVGYVLVMSVLGTLLISRGDAVLDRLGAAARR